MKPEDLPAWINEVLIPTIARALEEKVIVAPDDLSGENGVRSYLDANKPTAAQMGAGRIIFISDAAAGTQYRGSDGTAYINLG